MALEDLTGSNKYIANLVNTNPLSADDRREGDDHIRGIKNVLLNTFGALAGPASGAYVAKAGDDMAGQLRVVPGSLASPGLGFVGEVGLGWARLVTSVAAFVAQGAEVLRIGAGQPGTSSMTIYPRAAGVGVLSAAGGPATGTPTKLSVSAGATNGSIIMTDGAGSSTTLPILYDAGAHTFNGMVNTANQTVSSVMNFTAAGGGMKFTGITGSTNNTMAIGWDGGHAKIRVDSSSLPSPLAFVSDISDIRLKKRVAPLPLGLAAVLALEPIEYEFDHAKREMLPQGRHYGFSAQALQKVVPQAVTESDDVLMVNQTQLIPVLVRAVQELSAEVEGLKMLCAGIGDA